MKNAVAPKSGMWYNARQLKEEEIMSGRFEFTWFYYFGFSARSGFAHA